MSKVSRSDNVYHLRHTRCARVAQRADLRCTASSFVISVFVCGTTLLRHIPTVAALMLYRLWIYCLIMDLDVPFLKKP